MPHKKSAETIILDKDDDYSSDSSDSSSDSSDDEADPSWNERIKQSLEGRALKDTSIKSFFSKKRGQKSDFHREREMKRRRFIPDITKNKTTMTSTTNGSCTTTTVRTVITSRRSGKSCKRGKYKTQRGHQERTVKTSSNSENDEERSKCASDSGCDEENGDEREGREATKEVAREDEQRTRISGMENTSSKTILTKTDWSIPKNFSMLREAMLNSRLPRHLRSNHNVAFPLVPYTTIRCALKRLGKKEVTHENVFPSTRNSLLSNEQVEWLQDIIHQHDINSKGMSRREAITIIAEVGRCSSMNQAEDHYNYLVKKKRLAKLKRNGRVITAQSITSERSQISIRQQYRWHLLIDRMWEDLRRKNCTPQGEFIKKAHYCQINLDETCFIASEGTLKVLADAGRKKHNVNVADCRESITCLRVGSAAGVNGPVVFLTKGKEIHRRFSGDRLHTVYGLPKGSCVIPTPNGYMDDEAWLKVVKIVAPALRQMEVCG